MYTLSVKKSVSKEILENCDKIIDYIDKKRFLKENAET